MKRVLARLSALETALAERDDDAAGMAEARRALHEWAAAIDETGRAGLPWESDPRYRFFGDSGNPAVDARHRRALRELLDRIAADPASGLQAVA
jgi:hypothetical protein